MIKKIVFGGSLVVFIIMGIAITPAAAWNPLSNAVDSIMLTAGVESTLWQVRLRELMMGRGGSSIVEEFSDPDSSLDAFSSGLQVILGFMVVGGIMWNGIKLIWTKKPEHIVTTVKTVGMFTLVAIVVPVALPMTQEASYDVGSGIMKDGGKNNCTEIVAEYEADDRKIDGDVEFDEFLLSPECPENAQNVLVGNFLDLETVEGEYAASPELHQLLGRTTASPFELSRAKFPLAAAANPGAGKCYSKGYQGERIVVDCPENQRDPETFELLDNAGETETAETETGETVAATEAAEDKTDAADNEELEYAEVDGLNPGECWQNYGVGKRTIPCEPLERRSDGFLTDAANAGRQAVAKAATEERNLEHPGPGKCYEWQYGSRRVIISCDDTKRDPVSFEVMSEENNLDNLAENECWDRMVSGERIVIPCAPSERGPYGFILNKAKEDRRDAENAADPHSKATYERANAMATQLDLRNNGASYLTTFIGLALASGNVILAFIGLGIFYFNDFTVALASLLAPTAVTNDFFKSRVGSSMKLAATTQHAMLWPVVVGTCYALTDSLAKSENFAMSTLGVVTGPFSPISAGPFSKLLTTMGVSQSGAAAKFSAGIAGLGSAGGALAKGGAGIASQAVAMKMGTKMGGGGGGAEPSIKPAGQSSGASSAATATPPPPNSTTKRAPGPPPAPSAGDKIKNQSPAPSGSGGSGGSKKPSPSGSSGPGGGGNKSAPAPAGVGSK